MTTQEVVTSQLAAINITKLSHLMRSGHIYCLEINKTSAKTKSKGHISRKVIVTKDIVVKIQKPSKEKEVAKIRKFIAHD